MNGVIAFIPLLPLTAAVLIAFGNFSGWLTGVETERFSVKLTMSSIGLVCLLALATLLNALHNHSLDTPPVWHWLELPDFKISLQLFNSPLPSALTCLFALLLFIVMQFSINYMHREPGFHRFFAILNLFAAAMLLLVLSSNMVGTFIGWELAGLSSYLLIGYFQQRPMAVTNATRVFLTNRIGDAGFIFGLGLSYSWLGSLEWQILQENIGHLTSAQRNALAFSFTIAACAKSAQWPFTHWLARAMEGPTPSSSIFYGGIMVHAGVYLLWLLQPLFEQAPLMMLIIAAIGLITAVYSFLVGLTQTDIKSSLVYATSAQVGLMFLECGLGFWQLALWHLAAHAVVRSYLLLTAPSLMHKVHGSPIKPVSPKLAQLQWAYVASLQRGWLEALIDWAIIKPVRGLAHDLNNFDEHILDRLIGAPLPAIRRISSLAQFREQKLGARLDNDADEFAQGSGLAGKLTQWCATLFQWFEARFVLRNHRKSPITIGRQLGHTAHKFERLILRPRNLVLFVFILLLSSF